MNKPYEPLCKYQSQRNYNQPRTKKSIPYATQPKISVRVRVSIKINQARKNRAPTRLTPLNLVKPKARITSKPKYIHTKSPFKKITKYEGVIDYKIISEIYLKIQANASTIQSELGGGLYDLLGLAMQPYTHWTVPGHDFEQWDHPTQAAPVSTNAAASEASRWIQHHASQVD